MTGAFDFSGDAESVNRQIAAMVEGVSERGHPPLSLDETLAQMREFAEGRVSDFESEDDDVMPMTHLEGESKSVIFVHPFSGDEQEKFVYDELVPSLVRALYARCFVSVQPVWMLENADRLPEGMRAKQHPDRKEGIVVFGSDGVRAVSYLAFVTRDGEGAPRLEPWLVPDEEPAEQSSWKVRPAALQLVYARMARAHRLRLKRRSPDWWTPERLEAFEDLAEMAARNEVSDRPKETWKALYQVDGETDPSLVEFAKRDDLWDLK